MGVYGYFKVLNYNNLISVFYLRAGIYSRCIQTKEKKIHNRDKLFVILSMVKKSNITKASVHFDV